MTQPPVKDRKEAIALLLILAVAAWLRLRGVGFGLPALNDADEPLFMMTAIDMLRGHTLNPGWFGHPGTTTLYCLAAIIAGVAGLGIATGRFADAEAFAQAVYFDPGIAFLPGRLFIVACGLACVVLTWRLGRKLGGARLGSNLGLSAAALLAVNAVHIEYSQIIRTDMQAGVFMLLAVLAAVDIAREARQRSYVLAGIWVGLAVATKWPAALIGLGPIVASLARDPRDWRGPALFGATAAGALFIASPYLLLDYQTVLHNLSGEGRPTHPGATGSGFLGNLAWYAMNPLLGSLGVAGLALATIGAVWGASGRGADRRVWLTAVLPGFLAVLLVLACQALRWERWVVPLLPFLCLAAARALLGLAGILRWPRWVFPLALAGLAVPMIHAAELRAAERANDTRQIAAAWVRTHLAPGRSIVVEHAAFDLLQGRWRLRFPLGSAGCLDARALLSGRVRYAEVEGMRGGSPIVDLAHVDPGKRASCRADYAVLSHYARYTAGSRERAVYDRLIAQGKVLAVIRPRRGASSGPVIHIVELSGTD